MKKLFFAIVILLIILPIEIYFSEQANFTVNWVTSGLFYVASYFSVFLCVLFLILNENKLSIAMLAIGLLVVVPYNIYCVNDLQNLKAKSDNIVHWVYQQQLKTGAFPKTITSRHDCRITYTKEEDGFTLFFYVMTPNTGHFYSSKNGWGYMDD